MLITTTKAIATMIIRIGLLLATATKKPAIAIDIRKERALDISAFVVLGCDAVATLINQG